MNASGSGGGWQNPALLIALVKESDLHYATAVRFTAGGGPLGKSPVAWMEFHSKSVHPQDVLALRMILSAGIVPFDETAATLAGELYFRTGARHRTRLDTMIAATAILAGAELATVNRATSPPSCRTG